MTDEVHTSLQQRNNIKQDQQLLCCGEKTLQRGMIRTCDSLIRGAVTSTASDMALRTPTNICYRLQPPASHVFTTYYDP